MSKPIIAAARQIAGNIRLQEESLDETLAGQAKLVSELVEARRSAGLPAAVGADIVDQAILAVTQAGELRRTMLSIHANLAKIDIRSVGDTVECPDEYIGGALRVVETGDRRASA